uniref:WD repeat-containing protein mio-like n=1 Tax=Saccoglossus kowalevskii TaxID=10224 RepID=A0ABM0MM42_SACKO|nr:PREDICTED: WD repeat-containing protein mio-like [Saccoglossus kowalevskii]
MAASTRFDISWSPINPDKFLTFGVDISLYRVENITEDKVSKSQGQAISDGKCANLIAVNNDHQYNMKCVSWYPKPEPDNLLAIGLNHGKVILTSFGQESDPQGLIGKVFVPKHARTCHTLSWNPIDSNFLAAAFGEKSRYDPSILIWDINAKPAVELSSTPERTRTFPTNIDSSSSVTKPVAEFGASETTMSLAWSYHEQQTLIAGMNNKHLRLYDLRDSTRPVKATVTKAVYGITPDPHTNNRLASYCDGQVSIWDLRNFDKPIITLSSEKHNNTCISKLSWCPTRLGLLAVLPKDNPIIKLYDIQHATFSGDDVEPTIIERTVQPYGNHSVSSFAWHPTHENRMLTITPGATIKDITVFERIALAWSPHTSVTWSCGKKLLHISSISDDLENDISAKMKCRASHGYGLHADILANLENVNDFDSVTILRQFTQVTNLKEDSKVKLSGKTAMKLPGVKSIVKGETNSSGVCIRSNQTLVEWDGLDWTLESTMYTSEARTRILHLCGWRFDRDDKSIMEFLAELEEDGEYERAAAVSLFNLKLKQTIQTLNRGKSGADLNLTVVAMALSGYTDDKNTLWREMCSALCKELKNPYLRAMFSFLISDSDNYDSVLKLCLSDINVLEVFLTIAKFDVCRSQCDPSSRPSQQVFISCNFCGKSIASNMLTGSSRSRVMTSFGGGIANKSKISSCPSCRKPLPRCAICLMNMGTPATPPPTNTTKEEIEELTSDTKRSQFNNWFTWCQTCRHGGHATHMTSWFR